ncbi:hypothetical protein RhiJN_18649 [Ceratobasidium sp. AG-Ba]|nr:hypothetical protein RhiJN_18649 [Ceratobasidium sp. AG-Ba]
MSRRTSASSLSSGTNSSHGLNWAFPPNITHASMPRDSGAPVNKHREGRADTTEDGKERVYPYIILADLGLTAKDNASDKEQTGDQQLQDSTPPKVDHQRSAKGTPDAKLIMAVENGIPDSFMVSLNDSSNLTDHLEWLEQISKERTGLCEIVKRWNGLNGYKATLSGQVLEAVVDSSDTDLVCQSYHTTPIRCRLPSETPQTERMF